MHKAALAAALASGCSIESIAREHSRDPSTVAYWVNKHGLTSSHAARHAPRGGIPRERLEELVAAGLSIRAIAEQIGVSYATVQHWLRKYGLETARARRRRKIPRPGDDGPLVVEGTCEVHGPAEFGRRSDGYYRCLACRAEAVVKRRRTVKQTLVEEAGGACRNCGYDRFPAALQFHHVDPRQKAFSLSHRGVTIALDAARAEAAKCVLLCANCHAEVEGGFAVIREGPTIHATPPLSGVAQISPG